MSNILQNIGDQLLVRVQPQLKGRVTLTGFTDSLSGITATRNVKREYQYTTDDGIFWSEYKDLTPENLSSEVLNVDNSLIIIVRYTRIGSDASGAIMFNNINFTGSWQSNEMFAPTLSNSIFGRIIGTAEYTKLFRNIFKKLYFRGILPEYITRGANRDKREDEDFISLASTIARFFSLFIRFFKRFENFRNDEELLREQVRQYGIYFNERTITLQELQYLTRHLFNQANQRGTRLIFYREGQTLPNGNIAPIDGEFIRLLQQEPTNELLFEEVSQERIGWCMRQSSPMYRGTSFAPGLNKTLESSEDFISLNDFTTSVTGNGSVLLNTIDGKQCLQLKSNGDAAALGRISTVNPINHLYTVDSQMDYEITFMFYLQNISPSTGEHNYLTTPHPDNILTAGNEHIVWQGNPTNIQFGVEGFDKHGNLIANAFINLSGNTLTDEFFQVNAGRFNNGMWYLVRGIIHAYNTHPVQGTTTNIGFGEDLVFNNSLVAQILPHVILRHGSTTANVNIWNYKIRPLVRGKNILPLGNGEVDAKSYGFIQSNRFMFLYARNNNISQSQDDVTNIIERYLLPYNMTNMYVFTGNN